MSKKYIIEIEDEPLVRNSALHGETSVYKAVGFNSLVFDQNGLDKLIPYEEVIKEENDIDNQEYGIGSIFVDEDGIVCCLLDMDIDQSGWFIDEMGCVDYRSFRNMRRYGNRKLWKYLDDCIENIVKVLQDVREV